MGHIWYNGSDMERPDPSLLRNVGFLAHIDAGKTSLSESALALAGAIREPGSVDSGDTETDYLRVERERGITVKAAATYFPWRGMSVNLIDTPGHVDFSAEVDRSLRVLDGAVVLVCGVAGIQSRTEAIWRACDRAGLSRLLFVNKMDRGGASFERCLVDAVGKYGDMFIAIQFPVVEDGRIIGIVDTIGGSFIGEEGKAALPPGLEKRLVEERATLAAALADRDEAFCESFLTGREAGPEETAAALRRAVVAGKAVPVLCGSALSGIGVAALLDAVLDYLPSPVDKACPELLGSVPGSGLAAGGGRSRLSPSLGEGFSSIIFRIISDPFLGKLAFIRVFSGSLEPGSPVWDSQSGKVERIQRLYRVRVLKREEIPFAGPGDIVALSGLSAPRTGSSLSSPSIKAAYEPIAFAQPLASIAIEPRSKADAERMSRGMAGLLEQDPSLSATESKETGQFILSGMGELHLDVAVERLREEYGVKVRTGEPVVAYRESLVGRSAGSFRFDRESSGRRVRAFVELELAGVDRGVGLAFERVLAGKASPRLLEAAERGARKAAQRGRLANCPMTDLSIFLLALDCDAGDAGELAVEVASAQAFADALSRADVFLIEPWLALAVEIPEAALGEAVAALVRRQGRIESMEDGPVGRLLVAQAPLRSLFGFASELRSLSNGLGSYSARPSGYEAVPRSLQGAVAASVL